MSQEKYIHGFNSTEEDRLYHQAVFLEAAIYEPVYFEKGANVVEVGSGVGAQTQILLRRFPSITLSCLDAASSQIERARVTLKNDTKSKRVNLFRADAANMPFKSGQFDGAFLIWILEHVSDPLRILQETRRCLTSGALVYCTEVMNSSLFIWPLKTVIERVWAALNESQIAGGGDPFIGVKLPSLFFEAGFKNIEVRPINYLFDSRDTQKRSDFFSYWEGIVLSAMPGLIASGRLNEFDTKKVKDCFDELRSDPKSIFSYCCYQIKAQA